jgi:hypothetical protein
VLSCVTDNNKNNYCIAVFQTQAISQDVVSLSGIFVIDTQYSNINYSDNSKSINDCSNNTPIGTITSFPNSIYAGGTAPSTETCISFLNDKDIKEVKPYSPYFKGDYIQDENNNKKWILRGKVKVSNTTTVNITELPPSITYEKYEEILDGLVEDKVIVNYEDNCKDDINYVIKFTRENLAKLDEFGLIKLLKLEGLVTK